jgi:AraC-like DNA-binding protein
MKYAEYAVTGAAARFVHCYWTLSSDSLDLAADADPSGYFDHSHFVRDCRDIAGETPGQLLGRSADVTTAFLGAER